MRSRSFDIVSPLTRTAVALPLVVWAWRLALDPRRLAPRYLRCAVLRPWLLVGAGRAPEAAVDRRPGP